MTSRAARDVRIVTGLRAASQSMAWIGAKLGIFESHGLHVTFPKLEVGGPECVAGLLRGDWDFAQTGTVPIVERYLKAEMLSSCFKLPPFETISSSWRILGSHGSISSAARQSGCCSTPIPDRQASSFAWRWSAPAQRRPMWDWVLIETSLRLWLQEKSMLALCRSIFAFSRKLKTAGTASRRH